MATALTDATAGQGRIVLLSGEAGIGKTALLRSFLGTLPRNVRVLRGACDDLLTPAPLGPVRDVARTTGGRVAAAVVAGGPDLFGALLDELGKAPTVLAIEDVHWADEATLDLLTFLGRRLEQVPALLVLTHRDEAGAQAPLRRLLGGLAPPVAVRVALPPLSLPAVRELAADAGTALRVYGQTRGNPFLVTELLAAGGDGLPASVEQSMLGRLARLPAAGRALVEQVAVVPARVEVTLLERLHPGWAVDSAAAEELGVLELREGGVAFRHELARQAVAETLPRTRRLVLNQAVLTGLLDSPDPDLARVLHHAERCGATEVVVEHGPVAARAAAAAGAHGQALAFYAQLMPYADRLPESEQAAVAEEYAAQLYNAHRFDDAVAAAERAVRLRERFGDPARLGQAMVTLSRLHYMRADLRPAMDVAEQAVTVLEATADQRRLALARGNRGVLLALSDREPEALLELEATRGLAAEVGDHALDALCLTYLGLARVAVGETGRGLALLHTALSRAAASGNREYLARAHTAMTRALVRTGQFAELAPAVEAGLAWADDADFRAHAYTLRAHRCLLAAVHGDWDTAVRELGELDSDVPEAGVLARETLPLIARLAARRGDPEAGAALARCWRLARRAGTLSVLAPTAVAAVEHGWLTGDPDAARPGLALLARLRRPGTERWLGELLRWLRRVGEDVEPFPGCPDEYAAGLSGDWRAAAAAWASVGAPYEQALELAEASTEEPLLEALRLLDDLGAAPAAAQVRRRLRELGVRRLPRGPRDSTRANPAGLTDRQLDVLTLLGEGLSNAEIAARLVVSVRTVDHHVSAVLAKLNVRTRREAAQLAGRLA
jgi:DNA-binding CsgD family transcriptional regulator/tetratricopeptide (TPR) repeat protein